ncbi:MAG: signal peptidase II [Candidatus Eisenbacteria bacterium]|nr:signal peptidase II [Candidatus Eisenbacteria bacterium]
MSGRALSRRFLLWALIVVVVDQATKLAVHSALPLNGPPLRILGDLLRLTHIHNPGAAFGLFQGNRWFFMGVSILSMLVLVFLARDDRYRDRWMTTAFGLIFGGALGNLIDRIWLGVVVDFVQMGVAGHYLSLIHI